MKILNALAVAIFVLVSRSAFAYTEEECKSLIQMKSSTIGVSDSRKYMYLYTLSGDKRVYLDKEELDKNKDLYHRFEVDKNYCLLEVSAVFRRVLVGDIDSEQVNGYWIPIKDYIYVDKKEP